MARAPTIKACKDCGTVLTPENRKRLCGKCRSKPCSMCERPVYARGLCNTHYNYELRSGRLAVVCPKSKVKGICRDCGVTLTSANRGPSNGNLCNPCRSVRQNPPRPHDPKWVAHVERRGYLRSIGPNPDRKVCAKCGEEKPRQDFTPNAQLLDGLKSWCKKCCAAVQKAAGQKDPDNKRRIDVRTKYKIEVDDLWHAQKGLCGVCRQPMEYGGRKAMSLAVDHDHSCCPGVTCCGNCVRDLVHRSCNALLGHAREDVAVLKGAIKYLNRWKNKS